MGRWPWGSKWRSRPDKVCTGCGSGGCSRSGATGTSPSRGLGWPSTLLRSTTGRCAVATSWSGRGSGTARGAAIAAYIGSGEWPIRLNVLRGDSIGPGETGLVRVQLPQPLLLVPGDRFVVRDLGRAETIGGGEVLDVDPVLPASRARPDLSIDRVIAERGWVRPDQLERLTGERREPTVGSWVVDSARLATARTELAARIEAAPAPGLDVAELAGRCRAGLP